MGRNRVAQIVLAAFGVVFSAAVCGAQQYKLRTDVSPEDAAQTVYKTERLTIDEASGLGWTKDGAVRGTLGFTALPTLAAYGDVCAASEGVQRNATDDANVCVDPEEEGQIKDTNVSTDCATAGQRLECTGANAAAWAATPTPTVTPTTTPNACATSDGRWGGMYGQGASDDPLCFGLPTATVTTTPGLPISVGSPSPVVGTSAALAKSDHRHQLDASGVTPDSYSSANITVDVFGRITAATSGASIPAAFALYVDKAGQDGTACGPVDAPCLTVTGANGANAKILANNDNGFWTCANDPSAGCGKCSDPAGTACNEDADCAGGAVCSYRTCSAASTEGCAWKCSTTTSKDCVEDAQCPFGETCNTGGTSTCSSGTCGTNATDRCTAGAACTGPVKRYAVIISTGKYVECMNPWTNTAMPSPGGIVYAGAQGETTTVFECWQNVGIAFDLTHRHSTLFAGLQLGVVGNADVLGSRGDSKGAGIVGGALATVGAGRHWRWTGRGNNTSNPKDVWLYGGTGDTCMLVEAWPPGVCRNDATRQCLVDGDCASSTCTGRACYVNPSIPCTLDADCGSRCNGGTNHGAACTVASECPSGTCAADTCQSLAQWTPGGQNGGGSSSDWFAQDVWAECGAAGGYALDVVGRACGNAANLGLVDSISTVGGVRARVADCNTAGIGITGANPGVTDLLVELRGTRLYGNPVSGHNVNPLTIKGASLAIEGVVGYDATKRSTANVCTGDWTTTCTTHSQCVGIGNGDKCAASRLLYRHDGFLQGGQGFLGNVNADPPQPRAGEVWYNTTSGTMKMCEVDGTANLVGDVTQVGSCTSGLCFGEAGALAQTNPVLTFEGTTADAVETFINVDDPTSGDKGYNIPNNSNCLAGSPCRFAVAGTAPLSVDANGQITCATAASGVAGCLPSTAFDTFNNKVSSVSAGQGIAVSGTTTPTVALKYTDSLTSNSLGENECVFSTQISGGGIICESSGTGGALSNEVALAFAQPSGGDFTVTVPAETGTVCTTAGVCTGYQAGPLSGAVTSSGAATTYAGTVPVNKGGTGLTSYTTGAVLYASGATTIAGVPTALPTPRVLLNTGASSAPAWGQVDLATGVVTGVLPKANLGTHDHSVSGEGGGTLAPTVLTVPYTAATPHPAPTAAGRMLLNTTTGELTAGDGSVAVIINAFVVSTQLFSASGLGFNTTTQYGSLFGSGPGQTNTTESNRTSIVPMSMYCDEMRVCGAAANVATEAVTFTVRDDGSDTALTCTSTGGGASTCNGVTDTAVGCGVTLSAPAFIAIDSLATVSVTCAGAGCPSVMTIANLALRCWNASG